MAGQRGSPSAWQTHTEFSGIFFTRFSKQLPVLQYPWSKNPEKQLQLTLPWLSWMLMVLLQLPKQLSTYGYGGKIRNLVNIDSSYFWQFVVFFFMGEISFSVTYSITYQGPVNGTTSHTPLHEIMQKVLLNVCLDGYPWHGTSDGSSITSYAVPDLKAIVLIWKQVYNYTLAFASTNLKVSVQYLHAKDGGKLVSSVGGRELNFGTKWCCSEETAKA